MRALGIETSGLRGSVALAEDDEVLAAFAHEQPHGHAERLLPLIDQALASAGWSRQTLGRVAVGVGPGSFTALRVGIALAQGIGLALGLPVVGVGSLLNLAAAVRDAPELPRLALLDARRDELYVAAYGADGRVVASPTLTARGQLSSWLTPWEAAVLVGGPQELELAAQARALTGRAPLRSVVAVVEAARCAQLGLRLSPELAPPLPDYVRDADAILPTLRQLVV